MENRIANLDYLLRRLYESYARTHIKNEWLKILINLEDSNGESYFKSSNNFEAIYTNFELVNPNGEDGGWLAAMKETYWGQKEAATKLGANLHPGSDYFVFYGEFSINNDFDYEQYPFTQEILNKIIDLKSLSVGNCELGEIIRIDNINPLRYLVNLEELTICNNNVKTLEPIWNLPNLKRIWIENTEIPILERELFRSSHPDCKLEDVVYL